MSKRSVLTIGLMVLAVILTVAGIILGQPREVLTQAINICLECVGIG